MKRDELQQLWLIWKGRHDNDDHIGAILNNKSASEESQHVTGITTTISDTDKAVVTCDHQAVNNTYNEGRHIVSGNKIINDHDFIII